MSNRKRRTRDVDDRQGATTHEANGEPLHWGNNGVGFGVGALLIGGLFLYFLGSRLLSDMREVMVYRRAVGTVTKYTPADKAADREMENGQVEYSYVVDGETFAGVYPPPQKFRVPNVEYSLLRHAWRPGEGVEVFYDPAKSSASTLEPRIEPAPFFFLTFIAPFIVLGVLLLWGRRDVMYPVEIGDGMQLAGGNVLILGYFILSAIGSFGGMFVATHLPWRVGCLMGLAMPTILVPAGAFALHRWTKRGAAQGRTAFVAMALTALFWWAIVGIFVGAVIYQFWWTAIAKAQYVETQATVTKSAIKTRHGEYATYEPIVDYRYEVNGVTYANDRMRYALWNTGEKAWADAELRRYPVGAIVAAYYDPKDPSESVLNRDYTAWDWFIAAVMMPFVAVGMILIHACVKTARNRDVATNTECSAEA